MEDLKVSDRCDRCGAQAFVRVHSIQTFTEDDKLIMGDLLFCGHHFTKYEDALVTAGYAFDDFRDKLNDKPSISATHLGNS